MKKVIKFAVAAAAIAGASLFASAPAQADSFGFRFGPHGGIGFSYDTGGYCDSWGCPDDFWDYPIAYCPVYFRGEWYRGPFYYIRRHGTYYFWIHGGWRRDEWWSWRRPYGACSDRFGPALDFDFYLSHGFRWNDDWRYRWYHRHGGHDWDRDRHRDWHDWNIDRHDHNRGDWNRGDDNTRVWDHSGDRHDGDGRVWDHHGDHDGDRSVTPFSGGTGGGSGGGGGDGGHHHHDSDSGGAPSTPPANLQGGSSPWGGSDGGRRHHDDSGATGGGTPPAGNTWPFGSGSGGGDGGRHHDANSGGGGAPAAAAGLPAGTPPPVATGGFGASGSGTGDGGHHHDRGSSDSGDSDHGDNGHHGHHETP
jgi:hypothetical protein